MFWLLWVLAWLSLCYELLMVDVFDEGGDVVEGWWLVVVDDSYV